MKKRFLSMLLVLVMVIGMIPFTALSTSAAQTGDTVNVTTWEELKTALEAEGDATIVVKQKIEKTLDFMTKAVVEDYRSHWDYYIDDTFIDIRSGAKTLVLDNDIIVTVKNPFLSEKAFGGVVTLRDGSLTVRGSGSFLGNSSILDYDYDKLRALSTTELNDTNPFHPVIFANLNGTLIIEGGTIGGNPNETNNLFGAIHSTSTTIINGGIVQGVVNYDKYIEDPYHHDTTGLSDYGYSWSGAVLSGSYYTINGGEIKSISLEDRFELMQWFDEMGRKPRKDTYLAGGGVDGSWEAATIKGIILVHNNKNIDIHNAKLTTNVKYGRICGYTGSMFSEDYFLDEKIIERLNDGFIGAMSEVKASADYTTFNVSYKDSFVENFGFSTLTPTPDMPQEDWDELASDLGTMALGSSDTNINFNFSAKTLPADAIEAGYSVKRALKVTRDGITVYDKEYESNEVYGWNLKDNIDEGGNYHIIPTLNYYLNGVKIEEISHLYKVKVTGSTIKTLTASGIATPVIGSAPSSGEFAKTNTDGVYIYEIEWYRAEENSYSGWVMMTEGETFVAGERYMVTVTFKTNDGYSFKEDPTLMKAYINGVEATVVENPYSKNKAYVDLEMTPITTPAFTTQPVGGMVAEGEKFTITWETNFKPAWIQILTFGSSGAPNGYIDVPADATSFELDANEFGYVLEVYYNGNQCVSNGEKFYVKAIKGISEVDVTVTEPTIGGTASKNITVNTEGAEATFMWVEVNGNGTYKAVVDNAIFESGKQYAAMITIRSANLNEYMLKEDVVVKVNGKEATNLGGLYVLEYEPLLLIDSIELVVEKPEIGGTPATPTIKSVNGDESLKDLVSFFSDSYVYWVEADSAEDIANGNKHPTVFADGKIYALHVAIQSTKEIAEDCVLNVYGTDGELLWSGNISFSDPSDKTLVYTDAYLGNFKLEIGNVNGDDLIDFTDLQRLYQHITGDSPLSGDALGAADVNADTVIDFSDLQALFALLSQNA